MPRRRCCPLDTCDDEWALTEALLPIPACEARTGGRPEKHSHREIVDAIQCVVDAGCNGRALPGETARPGDRVTSMPCWAAAGIVGQIRDQLRKRMRRERGRALGAVATVIDSQSVKAAGAVGRDFRGYDGAKKINGRKRRLVIDIKGLPLCVRHTRDYEQLMQHSESLITWAAITLMTRRITRIAGSGQASEAQRN